MRQTKFKRPCIARRVACRYLGKQFEGTPIRNSSIRRVEATSPQTVASKPIPSPFQKSHFLPNMNPFWSLLSSGGPNFLNQSHYWGTIILQVIRPQGSVSPASVLEGTSGMSPRKQSEVLDQVFKSKARVQ